MDVIKENAMNKLYEILTFINCRLRGHRFVPMVNRKDEVLLLHQDPTYTNDGKKIGFIICADCGRHHKIERYTYTLNNNEICITYNNGKEFTTQLPPGQ